MSTSVRAGLMLILVAVLFGGFGFWLGTAYGVRLAHSRPDAHDLLHHALDLRPDQERRLAALETQYNDHAGALRTKMDEANHDLANALSTEHGYGSRAQAALARYYRAAQELREVAILHAFAMRAVLDRDQIEKFDFAIRHAWAGEPPEWSYSEPVPTRRLPQL